MSAPTALETGALARGIAWPAKPKKKRHKSVTRDRRSSGPVALLSREHDDLCRQACDPLEIAAVLESAGLTDSRARNQFRSSGVFEVAEQLWRRVPWRPAPPGPRTDRWRLPLWRSQLRGVLYAAPAVVAAVIPARMTAKVDYVVLAIATVLAIAAAQALSLLGHLLADRGQTRALAQFTGASLGVALGVAALAGAISAYLGLPLALALGPAGQLLFVVSATLLMVGGHDRLLLALIAPGLLVIGAQVSGAIELPHVVRLDGVQCAAGATVLITALGAWVRVGRGRDGDDVWMAVGRAELSHSGVAALYGLGLGALVTYAVVGMASGRVTGSGRWMLVATLPLTATVGISEYLLHRARSRSVAALATTRRLDGPVRAHGFTAICRRQLRVMVAIHAATVTVATAVVLGLMGARHVEPALRGYAVGYAVLSVALLLTTTLLSLGYGGLAAFLACAGGGSLLLAGALPGLRGEAMVIGQLVVVVALLLVAYLLTVRRFVAVSVHR